MSDYADHYRTIAAGFTEKVQNVPAGAWDNPSPVSEWVARDVVRHLIEWPSSFFFEQWDVAYPDAPSVDDDPVAAWAAYDAVYRRNLEDPAIAKEVRETRMGPMSYEECFDTICTGDVFLHTWDLARATGQDERLDPDEVHRMFEGMEPMEQMLRESGQFGTRVPVPDDADEQTKLIGFIGRQP